MNPYLMGSARQDLTFHMTECITKRTYSFPFRAGGLAFLGDCHFYTHLWVASNRLIKLSTFPNLSRRQLPDKASQFYDLQIVQLSERCATSDLATTMTPLVSLSNR